jgi:hypothetical protein
MTEWLKVHAWKAISETLTEQHRDISWRNRFNDLPLRHAPVSQRNDSRKRSLMATAKGKKTCFVVMGFGEKIDYRSNPQRALNLDAAYREIIWPSVTEAGLNCIRADEIIHSTVIDKPMYEHLWDADLVIADLSTSDANAIYELGVRHALRPHATIIIAADTFAFPFDLNHLNIIKYEHFGKDIGYGEVKRMRGLLRNKIAAVLNNAETDSPVFLFLPQLLAGRGDVVPPTAITAAPKDGESFADLLRSFDAAKERVNEPSDWLEAVADAKRKVSQPSDWLEVLALLRRLQNLQPNDPYIIQQCARATYRSEHPDRLTALHAARRILETLKPDTSSDAATVGVWGAIHKRLWEVEHQRPSLDKAIRSFARGYFMTDDPYNGINFAFLLNVRATTEFGDEATADRVLASRIRTEVLALCDTLLGTGGLETTKSMTGGTLDPQKRFWIRVTKMLALIGLGRRTEAYALRDSLLSEEPGPAEWMVESMNDDLEKLEKLI